MFIFVIIAWWDVIVSGLFKLYGLSKLSYSVV